MSKLLECNRWYSMRFAPRDGSQVLLSDGESLLVLATWDTEAQEWYDDYLTRIGFDPVWFMRPEPPKHNYKKA